jgi:hypothetical protein
MCPASAEMADSEYQRSLQKTKKIPIDHQISGRLNTRYPQYVGPARPNYGPVRWKFLSHLAL